MRLLLFLLLFLTCAGQAFAQKKKSTAPVLSAEALARLRLSEDTLGILAFAVVNDSIEQERFAACRSLIQALVRALKVENSFQYPFSRLKSLSILAPPDSSFRIFTWQLFVNDSAYRYYGAIQMNAPKLMLYPLIDRSFEMDLLPAYEVHSPEKWYGALYYNLRASQTKEGPVYLLFGFDATGFFDRRKVVEVLRFDAAGKPVFGAPVFDMPPSESKRPDPYRLIFDYSAEASVRVNWDEQYQMVLIDHLIPMQSPLGRGITFLPDGSYDALQPQKNGRWKWVDKVFNDVMKEEFRPDPLLDSGRGGKNLMGKDGGVMKGRKKGG